MVNGMHVGTASVNWGFDPLYTWVRTPSFDRMLDEMAQAGYEGTEISYNFPDDAGHVANELRRRNLRPAATFHAVNLRDRGTHDACIESALRTADRLARLGSDTLILSDAPSAERLRVAGRAGTNDVLDAASWHAMADGLHRIAERLAERGMRAVFHPHVGTYVETRAEIERLCELTDPALLALCPDTGHLAYAGVEPDQVFADYRERIGHVHLKDVDPNKLERVRAERIGFVEAVRLGMFVELGRGMVPMERIIEALRAAEYCGWIIVEQDAPQRPLASATANREYLRKNFGL
jgi:inosose dehydratase